MKIVGCDLHTRYQQIAMPDQETGELIERRRVPHTFALFANVWESRSLGNAAGITANSAREVLALLP